MKSSAWKTPAPAQPEADDVVQQELRLISTAVEDGCAEPRWDATVRSALPPVIPHSPCLSSNPEVEVVAHDLAGDGQLPGERGASLQARALQHIRGQAVDRFRLVGAPGGRGRQIQPGQGLGIGVARRGSARREQGVPVGQRRLPTPIGMPRDLAGGVAAASSGASASSSAWPSARCTSCRREAVSPSRTMWAMTGWMQR